MKIRAICSHTNALFFDVVTNLTEVGTGTKERYIRARNLMIHVTMVAMAIQYDGCSAFYPCFCPTLLKKRLLTPIFLILLWSIVKCSEEFYIRDLNQALTTFVTSTTA